MTQERKVLIDTHAYCGDTRTFKNKQQNDTLYIKLDPVSLPFLTLGFV